MAEEARLNIILRLKDEASKRMKNVDRSFKQSGAKIGQAAAGGALVAGAAVAGVGKTMLDFGDDVKLAENQLRMGTGAMGDDLDALMDSTGSVSGQVPQDFQAVASAVADVSTEFGLAGTELEEMTKMFLDVSRVAGTEAGPMIKGVNDVMSVFGEDQTETNRILGDFIKISQDTGIPLEKLISEMTTYGPVLKNAGMRTDEAAAFIGTLNQSGIEASRVMPGLNARMRKLAEEGITDMKTALEDDIKFISTATDDTEALNRATDVFGSEGAQRMLAAIRAGLIPAHEDLVEKTRASADEVENLTKDTLTTSEQFSVMKNRLKAVIAPFADYIALIGAILIPLGLLAVAIGGVALAATALSIPLLPLLAVILAITAAVVAGVIIFKNWDKIVGFLGDTWAKVWGKMGGPVIAVVGTVKDAINGMVNAINVMIRGVNKIKIPSWIPGIGGKGGMNISEIPNLAAGGIVTSPTIARIGEAGPEAVIPLGGNGVGGMMPNITINFPQGSTVILDNEASARALADQITQQIRSVLRAQGSF